MKLLMAFHNIFILNSQTNDTRGVKPEEEVSDLLFDEVSAKRGGVLAVACRCCLKRIITIIINNYEKKTEINEYC